MAAEINERIREAKEKVGQEAESIIASGLGMQKKGAMYKCTNPENHNHGDKTPSMSWDRNKLRFKCFACPRTIDIYDYYKDHLNYTCNEILQEILGKDSIVETTMYKSRSLFEEGLSNIKQITPECIEYLKLRGITEKAIKHFELKSYNGMIAFPYFKKESVVGYKTRYPRKVEKGVTKMKSVPGSKPYLFNAKNVKPGPELIICEGECDCAILWECGFENVVSIGAGANSLNALLEQADDYLKSFTSLIVVGDNDAAGMDFNQEMIERYGERVKLVDRVLYGDSNDVNELYIRGKENGKSAVADLVESARWKIKGRRDLDKNPYTGITQKKLRFIPTGIAQIDDAINMLVSGRTTLITGRSNGGKTTLVKQIIANAIDKKNKVYVMSGEGNDDFLINEIYQCVIGRDDSCFDSHKINLKWHKEPKKEVLEALQEWHKGKLVLFNKGESKLKSTDELFLMLEEEVKLNQHDLIIIDNLMSCLKSSAVEKIEAQGEFMQRCHDLADTYNTHIILVLHPNKTYQKGQDMDFEQISGNSDIANKADNILCVIRNYNEADIANGVDSKITVLKNRYYPDLPSCELNFDHDTGLLVEIIDGVKFENSFNWRKYLRR